MKLYEIGNFFYVNHLSLEFIPHHFYKTMLQLFKKVVFIGLSRFALFMSFRPFRYRSGQA